MLKKTITYTDYDGLERTEEFRFNLTKAELMDMELTTVGTFSKLMQKIRDALDAGCYESFYQKYAQILDKRSTT